jgi:hypothetical protein
MMLWIAVGLTTWTLSGTFVGVVIGRTVQLRDALF